MADLERAATRTIIKEQGEGSLALACQRLCYAEVLHASFNQPEHAGYSETTCYYQDDSDVLKASANMD